MMPSWFKDATISDEDTKRLNAIKQLNSILSELAADELFQLDLQQPMVSVVLYKHENEYCKT